MVKNIWWYVAGVSYLLLAAIAIFEGLGLILSPYSGIGGAAGIIVLILGLLAIILSVGMFKKSNKALLLLSIPLVQLPLDIDVIILRITQLGIPKVFSEPNLYLNVFMLLVNVPILIIWIQKLKERKP